MYIDEKDLIELPLVAPSEGVNEPYQKKYTFNSNNLPYSMEQPHQYSQQRPSDAKQTGAQDRKGPRLNRYYETLPPFYKLKSDKDHTLLFESRFESGNLRRAVKISDCEYDLHLKNDYGTNGYTQWYFFEIKNARKDRTYRFNIVNLMKPDSNYNQGTKPLVYSKLEAETNQLGWYRDGSNIAYYQSARKKKSPSTSNAPTYSLSTVST